MDWHQRFLQQAAWTREIREYLLTRAGFENANRVLEVGAGTGAVLKAILARSASRGGNPRVHGLDISSPALRQAAQHAPAAHLCRADAHQLPYGNASFDIVLCHFLLLWVRDPTQVLREMRRVTRPGGCVLAIAEPDYLARTDNPPMLARLGRLQVESLKAQGADPSIGATLPALFGSAHLRVLEADRLSSPDSNAPDEAEVASEHEVLRQDLRGMLPPDELETLLQLDLESRRRGERDFHVPTYFAFAQV